jgi:hypothetical protein
MGKISYAGYRFPPEIIHQAIWLYLRFTLSFRDVEDLLAERGIAVSYETVRRWVNHFGPMIAAHLRKRRPKPHAIWASRRSLPENRWADGLSVARRRRRGRGSRGTPGLERVNQGLGYARPLLLLRRRLLS